jgi:hypothetical protein
MGVDSKLAVLIAAAVSAVLPLAYGYLGCPLYLDARIGIKHLTTKMFLSAWVANKVC